MPLKQNGQKTNQKNNSKSHNISVVENGNKYEIPDLNGRRVPRVSTVTGLLDKSRPLMYWSAKITAAYAVNQIQRIKDGELTFEDITSMDLGAFYREAKAEHEKISKLERDKGSRVHDIAKMIFSQMIKNSDIEVGEVDPDIYAPVNGLIDWIKNNDFRPVMTEVTVWSKSFRGYGGRLDVTGLYNKRLLTIDVKSSSGIYDDMKIQVAGYDHAYEERNPGTYTDGTGILRLDKETGMYEFAEYPKHLTRKHLAQFGHLCLLWHTLEDAKEISAEIKQKKKEKKKEAKKQLVKIPKDLPYPDPF